MKTFLLFILIGFTSVFGAHRGKRAAYDLPDAIGLLLDPLRTTFVCTSDGYFADQDNNCQIFHVCHTAGYRTYQYSFICGNLTIFNQRTFTCTYPEDAVPCERAHEYYSLNDAIGDPNAVFQGGDGAGGTGGNRGSNPFGNTGPGGGRGGLGGSGQGGQGGLGGPGQGGRGGLGGPGQGGRGGLGAPGQGGRGGLGGPGQGGQGGLGGPGQDARFGNTGVRGGSGVGGIDAFGRPIGGAGLYGDGGPGGVSGGRGGSAPGGGDQDSIELIKLKQALKKQLETAIRESDKEFKNLERQIDIFIATDNRPELRKLRVKVLNYKGKVRDLINQIRSLDWEDDDVVQLRIGAENLDTRADELIAKIDNHLNS